MNACSTVRNYSFYLLYLVSNSSYVIEMVLHLTSTVLEDVCRFGILLPHKSVYTDSAYLSQY